MIDLDKEFRTLRLLASVFIIIGAGLTIGGFGLAILMNDAAMNERKPAKGSRADSAPASKTKTPTQAELKEKFSSSTSQIGTPTGILGVLLLICGIGLRLIIRSNFDDGDEAQSNPELFRAYAAQLVVAEQKRAKNQKPPK